MYFNTYGKLVLTPDELLHYGVSKLDGAKRGSGRYPLGSGDRPHQHDGLETKTYTSYPRNYASKKSFDYKKALKIGAAIAGTALVTYGAYKLSTSKQGQELVNKFLNEPNISEAVIDNKNIDSLDKVLSPIADIQSKASIDNLVDGDWEQSLSADEQKSIKRYSNFLFYSINGTLRNYTNPNRYKDPDIIKDAINIESAINKYELKKETVFTRYTNSDFLGGAATESDIRKMVGSIIHDDGFCSSTSGSKRIEDTFNNDGNIKFLIKTPPGKGIGAYIKNISEKGDENEFLFNRGSDFEISDVKTEAGKIVVDLLYKGSRKGRIG